MSGCNISFLDLLYSNLNFLIEIDIYILCVEGEVENERERKKQESNCRAVEYPFVIG